MGSLKRFFFSAAVALLALLGTIVPAHAADNAFIEDAGDCIGQDQDAINAIVEAGGNNDSVLGTALDLVTNQGVTNCVAGSVAENPGAATAAVAGAVTSAFWGDAVGKFTQAVLEGNGEVFQYVMTFWMDFRIDGGAVDSQIQGIKNITWGLSAIFLVISLMVGGGRIAAARRQGLTDETLDTGNVVVRYLIFSLAVPAAVPGALVASDMLSEWIMSFGATDETRILEAAMLDESMAGPVVMLVLGLFAIAGSFMQVLALATRVLLLPIIAGVAPLFAAASFSETGRGAVKSMVSWLIAAIVFKPAASLLYAGAFWVVGDIKNGALTAPGQNDVLPQIMGALIFALAGFTAPALLRVIAPMVAAAGGGGGAPVIATGAAMGGAALGLAGAAVGMTGRVAGAAMGAGSGAGSGSGSSLTAAGTGSSPTAGGGGSGRTGSGGGGGSQPTGGGGGVTQPTGGGGGARPTGGRGHGSTGARPVGAAPGRTGAARSTAGSWARGTSVHARAVLAGLTGSLNQATPQTPTTTPPPILDDTVGATGPYQGQVRR